MVWLMRLILIQAMCLLQVCNNLVLGVSMAAVAEGLALGSKLGLDPKLLSEIFNSSSARCWSSDSYNPCPVCFMFIHQQYCIQLWHISA